MRVNFYIELPPSMPYEEPGSLVLYRVIPRKRYNALLKSVWYHKLSAQHGKWIHDFGNGQRAEVRMRPLSKGERKADLCGFPKYWQLVSNIVKHGQTYGAELPAWADSGDRGLFKSRSTKP